MNIFNLIAMSEAIAGPDAFNHALRAADEIIEALVEQDDRADGRTGRSVPPAAAPLTVAMHSAAPPRARCCRVGRGARRTEVRVLTQAETGQPVAP